MPEIRNAKIRFYTSGQVAFIPAGTEVRSMMSHWVSVEDASGCDGLPLSTDFEVRCVDIDSIRPWNRWMWLNVFSKLTASWRSVAARWVLIEHKVNWRKK